MTRMSYYAVICHRKNAISFLLIQNSQECPITGKLLCLSQQKSWQPPQSGILKQRLSYHPSPQGDVWQCLGTCFGFCDSVCVCVCILSPVWLFVTPWTVAWQVPLSMGFFRQEYWNGLPFPSPEDLPHPSIEPSSPMSPALAGGFFTRWATWGMHHSRLVEGCHSE